MGSFTVVDFNLAKTLECGQIFRFEKICDWYFVSHRDKLFKFRQEGNKLFFKGADKNFIIDFFRLDDDYDKIVKSISNDRFIKRAIKVNLGLRLIRQDPWECLISYICSSNANIPKIKKNLSLISQKFGKALVLDGYKSYSFPNPGEIGCKDTLKECKVGYRDEFIARINSEVNENALRNLRGKSYEYARKLLMKLHGVGEKVADCVCMFSLDKLDAFPVDVWIKRVVQENYFKNKEITKMDAWEFGTDYFGRYAAYANQFLFYYGRDGIRK